jgi:hypothetical protein
MTDAPIVPIENEAPPAVEIKPTAVEAPSEPVEIDKIDSSSVIEKKFESLVAQYEREGRPDARDEAALEVLKDIGVLTDVMSEEVQKRFIAAPTMIIEVLNRIGLKEGRAEILAPLGVEIGTLRNRLTVVRSRTKKKLEALRTAEKETKEREERKANYAERSGELNAAVKKTPRVSEIASPISEKSAVSPPEISSVEEVDADFGFDFESKTSEELKRLVESYDENIEANGQDNFSAFRERADLKTTDPNYSVLSERIKKNLRQIANLKKMKKMAREAIARKAETETAEPEAVVVATAAETPEPVVAADSVTTPESEADAEVVEQVDTKPMLAFLKAFGLPKFEYTGTTKKSSDQLIAENFYDYKKVFDQVIRNWESIPGSLRPPMLIVDGRGNKLPTFAKFAEAMVSASPKDREKIKNSYIEFTSVVGGGGAIGSLAGAELSGNSGSSGVNPETFFASHKTTANMGATRRSAVVPGTTSAARPVEAAPAAPIAEATPPVSPREEPSAVPEKMISGKWSGLLEKSGRRVENASTAVEQALQELPKLGRLEFGTQSEGNSLIVEKMADGKYKLTGIEGGKPVEKGVVDELDFQPEQGGSFFGLTWDGGEYRNIREYRSLSIEEAKPVVAAKPEGALPPPKKGKDVEELPEVDVEVPAESSPKASVFEMPVKKTLIEKVYRRLVGKDANFDLNEKETEGIKELAKKGRAIFEELTSTEPLWTEFKARLEELRKKLGREIEMSDVVFDPSFRKIQKDLVGDKPVLSVPQQIRRLFVLENILNSIGKGLEAYKTGTADKSRASVLGEDLKDLYDLIQDMSPVTVPKESVDSVDEPEVDEKDKVVAAPVEIAKDEKELLVDEYRKLSDLDLRKVGFDLLLAREKDETNPELIARLAAIDSIKGEKQKTLIGTFTEKHKGKSVSDLETRATELAGRQKELTSALVKSRKIEPRTAARETEAQIMLDLSECGAEAQAVGDLLEIKKAELSADSTDKSDSEAVTPITWAEDLKKVSTEDLLSRLGKLKAGENDAEIKIIQDKIDQRFEQFVLEQKEEMKEATPDELRSTVTNLEDELGKPGLDQKSKLTIQAKIRAARESLVEREKAWGTPPTVEAPTDLEKAPIDELFSRFSGLAAGKDKDKIKEVLDRRFEDLVAEEKGKRNSATVGELREEVSALQADDLLKLKETEEEAASSTTDVSDTPLPETAPIEAAPPAETPTSTPTETEASPVNPVAVSPVGPVEFNEATGEKRLEDMDASELQEKVRKLSGEKSNLEARLLTAKKNKKPKLQARLDSLNEELIQVNQELASR